METYFQSFHEDEQFSANSLLSNIDEVMTDHNEWENIKVEENVSWVEECNKNQYLGGKEDFQQLMSDWQQHVGLLNSSDAEDLVLGLDANLDVLNTLSQNDLFYEKESPILSKALKCPGQKNIGIIQSLTKSLEIDGKKELFNESIGESNESFQKNQNLYGLIKTEPQLIRKVTLVNGEKEILGKNIIGLHCLNEIKENPSENCQVTSTIINGKRYKIIIKPKSQKVKKLSEEKIRKTLIKKLLQCNLVTKMEPKQDEIISEMCNGNYDVPILNSDLLPSWDFASLDSEWTNNIDTDTGSLTTENEVETTKKVPPLKIKIPKLKKQKKTKLLNKSDEEIDVETFGDKAVEGNSLSTLLTNFEKEVAKLEKEDNNEIVDENKKSTEPKTNISQNIKNILPKEMIERIESLKRKKDHRIPLIQAMPTKKASKSGTRMQDAVATMNRNKLLKIVSGGDTIQLDHDYCSISFKTSHQNKQFKKTVNSDMNLAEKNPKKDSGMESGDVSDASEGPNTPDSLHCAQQSNNKMPEQQRFGADCAKTTKDGTAFFETSNTKNLNTYSSSSDFIKTKTVSNGNKALTNSSTKVISNSDESDTVPCSTEKCNKNGEKEDCANESGFQTDRNNCVLDKSVPTQNTLPKKKLKLEEYLNRRNRDKEKEKSLNNVNASSVTLENNKPVQSDKVVVTESARNKECESSKAKAISSNSQKQSEVHHEKNLVGSSKKENEKKTLKQDRNRRSSSISCKGRRKRSRSRSRSRSHRRSSSNSSGSRRLDRREKHRHRRSESRDRRRRKRRRRSFWSQSSSRESSSSSDCSHNKRYRRRSRSRSISPFRSRSRNRGFNRRRPNNCYSNRHYNRRSGSPYYAYSVREKQRQIEERRVVYIGRIEEGMTNAKLRERFSAFGPIIDISLHFREYGDNYGFVTYAYKADAYDAVEHGNDDPSLPNYDLCFGGRRGFCKERYADLDGMPTSYSGFNETPIIRDVNDSFDLLLKEAQEKLKNRKNH